MTVQYVGYLYDSKKKFASSWDEGKPFTFTLGKGEVSQGWEEGVFQMEVSDQRELIIPPAMTAGGPPKDVPKGRNARLPDRSTEPQVRLASPVGRFGLRCRRCRDSY